MNIDNPNSMYFGTLLSGISEITMPYAHPLALIDLIEKELFLEMRAQVISMFQVGDLKPFTGEFENKDAEIGDMTDAILETTTEMFPPEETLPTKLIDRKLREQWCTTIVERMDYAARLVDF